MSEYPLRDSIQSIAGVGRTDVVRSPYGDLLQGYRFTVCQTAEAYETALDVRRRVYKGTCGYNMPVPDSYDHRSWLLLAEHVSSAEAIGTMRITPRTAGRLEAEEYFSLPPRLRSPRTVEVNRFAILPAHMKFERFPAAVSFGLFKLMVKFVAERLGALYVLLCAREERIWMFEWLHFQRSGMVARYAKLGNVDHELLVMDVANRRHGQDDQALAEFLFEIEHSEIKLPSVAPALSPGVENMSRAFVLAMSA
jgi:hypothetical protein